MTQANYVQRLRLKFSKVGPTRYISHLDLARTLERAFNRARLPVAYTQGYNRRPRMQFAAALPLGFTSEAELADVWLAEPLEPGAARERMISRMAPGIIIHEVWEVPLEAPAMQASTVDTTYVATIPAAVDLLALADRVEQLLAAESLPRERRGKAYDLRPLVLGLQLRPRADGGAELEMRLMLRPGNTGRPDELLEALELDPLGIRAHRTAIELEDEAGGTEAAP